MGEENKVSDETKTTEVAWEGDGVRVLADGMVFVDWSGNLEWEPFDFEKNVVPYIARALAEAKRERLEFADVAARALTKAVDEAVRQVQAVPTPEEVARDWRSVVRCIHPGVQVQDWSPSLARLRDGAARAKALEAERDALARFKTYVHGRFDAAGVPTHPDGPHSREGCRIGDRLDAVLSERDDARREVEHSKRYGEQVTDLLESMGVSSLGVLADEFAALRERVATLEREKAAWEKQRVSDLSRAEAAERREAETAERLRVTQDSLNGCTQRVATLARRLEGKAVRELEAQRSTPPAPATYCSSTHEHPVGSWLMCDVKGPHETHGGTEPGGGRHTWRDTSPTPPTPAPMVLDDDGVEVLRKTVQDGGRLTSTEALRLMDSHDALTRRLAAHDAAKGGEVAPPGGDVPEEDRCSVCDRPHAGHPETNACAVTAYRQAAERATEKARKWDAVVERAKNGEAVRRAWLIGGMASIVERIQSLLEYLGLAVDTPPSRPEKETCPECDHAPHWQQGDERNAPHSYCSERASWSAPNCGCSHMPPPSGPGGKKGGAA